MRRVNVRSVFRAFLPWLLLAGFGLGCGGGGGGGGGGGPPTDLTGAWFFRLIQGGVPTDEMHWTVVQTGTNVRVEFTCRDDYPVGVGTYAAGVLDLTFDAGTSEEVLLTGTPSGDGIAGTFTSASETAEWRMDPTSTTLDCAHACDPVVPLRFVDVDFTDLAKIQEISRLRSAAGHDYSDDCETCRSMKHYFHPFDPYLLNGVIPLRSPVHGLVTSVTDEGHGASPPGENKQVRIRSVAHPEYTFILFHVDLVDATIVPGKAVAAGEPIGTARLVYPDLMEVAHDFDLGVELHTPYGGRYVSYFDVMTDALFATYQARGVATRADLVVSKSDRDADPLTCDGESFLTSGSLDSWFVLGP